jgi:hypothetical protein
MADATKRTRRRAGRYLDAGEIIELALLCEPRGRGLGHVIQLVFTDGSGIDVDVQMGQPIAKLVAALGTVAPIR